VILVILILLALRYSYIGNNLLSKYRNHSPIIKDVHKLIEQFGDVDDDSDHGADKNEYTSIDRHDEIDTEKISNDIDYEKWLDIKTENEELKKLFTDLDEKIGKIIS
jgi:hypothetical protein